MRAVVICPGCDGDGYLWDESACGDPEHCSPTYNCTRCNGTGEIEDKP